MLETDLKWYDRLKGAARRLLRSEAEACSLWTDDLVHETVVKFLKRKELPADRLEIVGLLVREMEQALVDYWRAKKSLKRTPAGERSPLEALHLPGDGGERTLEAARALFDELKKEDAEAGEAARMHWLHGFTAEEIGVKLDCPPRLVQRHLAFGRLWLQDRLRGGA